MASVKISALSAAAALGGTEIIPVVQGGVTLGATANQMKTFCGGLSFAIGSIIYGPSAPVDGGTWLQCNGQSVSQTTYASLYGVLAQDYLQYKLVLGTNPSATFIATTVTLFDGTKWIAINPSSASTFVSTDGQSWTAGGALNTALASPIIWTDYAGHVIVYNSAATTANFSSDHGATWAACTLPSTGAWQFANNGANVIGLKANSTTIIFSADSGATWGTSGSTLPVTPTALKALWYDSTQWVALGLLSTNAVQHIKTSVADGKSGWANTFTAAGIPAVNIPTVIPGTQKVLTDLGSLGLLFSTDSGDTYAAKGFPALTSTGPNTTIWNGLHYISPTESSSTGSGVYRIINATATSYYDTVPYASAATPFAGAAASWITNISAPGAAPITSYRRVDLTAHRCVVLGTQDLTGAGSTTIQVYTVEPNIDITTNFNVPNITYLGGTQLNIPSTKAWIKAL